ncbi:unnamed protein product [Bursaphelenchus okinawaensis]|uniref:Vesicle-fusing ATPase n=1 Tax=Bursaphelenchus okinawaensis TaxID=465554 RepID=A0A811JT55_9BILA|nr:unnamed protein product [Bursaphelenchus okinawaensis]CAG9082567.1 unnamed protein product [Bursaphelenchus okinawaensis]
MGIKLKTAKLDTDAQSLTNKVYCNPSDIDASQCRHVNVLTGPGRRFRFSLANDPSIKLGTMGFGFYHRKWAMVSLDQEIIVEPLVFSASDNVVLAATLSLDFQTKKFITTDPFDTDEMAKEFSIQFSNMVLTKGSIMVFEYRSESRITRFAVTVTTIEGATPGKEPKEVEFGPLNANARIVFNKAEGAMLNLVGSCKGKATFRALINPGWDFEQMGIGGLDKEFSTIFRRAFASRLFPPEYIEQLAIKHVRGILLYGPPGTGKTLIARQIGKMLNAREPKIVNGPDILNKYVGESEANLRKLFADAEEEWRRSGHNSGLHMIIFDELDAICKQRGSNPGSSGVNDTVVNQLLTKMDGVEQLGNVLVIGMTNRKDMIDDALLRPGRLEVQLEINLPDEHGRLQILNIHTARLRKFQKLANDVDLAFLAKQTKNFSGAEIEGLVRAAESSAMNRVMKVGGQVEIDPEAMEKFQVSMTDFEYAIQNDVKPAFGHNDEQLERLLGEDVIFYDKMVADVLREGELLCNQTASPETSGFVRALLSGPTNAGKSCLAAKIAKTSDFPFIKIITPEDMVGFSESMKCSKISRVFEDAYRSPLSIVIVDNIERLMDYSPIGPRYSNMVLQALMVLFNKAPPKKSRLLILATSANQSFIRETGITDLFTRVIHIPKMNKIEQVAKVLDEIGFTEAENAAIISQLQRGQFKLNIGIKTLLQLIENSKRCDPAERAQHLVHAMEDLFLDI